ncbi:MAG TPA: carbohydrate kinase family protein [Kaistia sp.]|nr:carbohydrate kinase family protein [Kaistia sp.]
MAPRLLCLGNLTIDTVVLPNGEEHFDCIGGDALYSVLAARLFEDGARMLAPIGDDLPASTLAFIEAGGLAEALPRRARPTLRTSVVYSGPDDRRWTFAYDEADFFDLSPRPEDIPAEALGGDAALLLAMSLKAQEDLVPFLRRGGTRTIALDPQQDYLLGNEVRLMTLIGQLDIFMPSAIEAKRLLGTEDWASAARQFAALGPSMVVIKLGGEGCLIHHAPSGRDIRIPAAAPDVVDTTGAGDSFCGGFMARLVQAPDDLEGAGWAGSLAAAAALSDFGARGIMRAEAGSVRAAWRDKRTPSGSAPAHLA